MINGPFGRESLPYPVLMTEMIRGGGEPDPDKLVFQPWVGAADMVQERFPAISAGTAVKLRSRRRGHFAVVFLLKAEDGTCNDRFDFVPLLFNEA
jgi:hypothetical protein